MCSLGGPAGAQSHPCSVSIRTAADLRLVGKAGSTAHPESSVLYVYSSEKHKEEPGEVQKTREVAATFCS